MTGLSPSQTDFTEDLKKIRLAVLVMHSEDDQVVPYADSGPLSAKLLKNGTLKTYKDFHTAADDGGGHGQRRLTGIHRGITTGIPRITAVRSLIKRDRTRCSACKSN